MVEFSRGDMMKLLLREADIYTENFPLFKKDLLIKDTNISNLGTINNNQNIKEIDLRGYKVIPGLIDMHIHGAAGYDTMDANYKALNQISKYLAKNGVTSFVPTTVTSQWDKLKKALKNVDECIKNGVEGAEIIGSYVEGPYISVEKKGAHPKKFIKSININDSKELLSISENIKLLTLAPEKEGALELIDFLKENNIEVSLGHTNSSYEEALTAIKRGAKLAVHTFNGMKGLHHREPGTVGAILSNKDIYAELIADNIHVHSAAMNILYRCKGKDKICLISDCMRAGGLADGQYVLGELDVTVKDSIARIDNGSLAGSTLKLIDAVKNMVELVGVDLLDAVHMASLNPAKLLDVDNSVGSIKVGKKANLVIIDDDYNVKMTIINGQIVFKDDDITESPKEEN